MTNLFHLGGWGMYPTSFFGLLTIAAAGVFTARGELNRLVMIRALSRVTLLAGALGFVMGCIKSYTACGNVDPRELPTVVVVGTGESLANVALALVAVVIASTLTAIGLSRGGPAPSLTDPHAR
jgi:hypothetical protein